ncbi:MAG: efflux transporter outer membrane subunit [Proteobacteria bacterium]|nr:efflux transporter outer membrane subunit [Pseudomonadota bacterium]
MKSTFSRSATAMACLILAGCVATPPTTPHVSQRTAQSAGLGTQAGPAIDARWWAAFGDAQLDGLMEKALAGNPTLAGVDARLRVAQSMLSESRAATYPQATFDVQEQYTRFSETYMIPPPIGGTTRWFGTVQANLNWSLDIVGKQKVQIERARATTQAAALDAAGARLALAGAVTQAYIALDRAYMLADVAEETLKQRQGIFDLASTRFESGLDNPANSKIAEALLSSAKVERTLALGAREIAAHQLAALTGAGAAAPALARPSLNTDALALPTTLPADLLARRADIAAAQTRVAAAMAGRELAQKEFYPDVNLVGAAGWASIGLSPLFTGDSLQYGAGPAIHLPLFDAGRLRAQYAAATASLDLAVADYNESLLTAVRETADALSTLKTLQAQAGDLARMRTAADATVDLEARRYKNGLSPLLNVLNAQDLAIRARRDSAALSADLASNRVRLVMALGGGFDPAKTVQFSLDAGSSHE